MPGVVVFRRRWAVGSDDLVVPGLFLIVFHIIWLLILIASLSTVGSIQHQPSSEESNSTEDQPSLSNNNKSLALTVTQNNSSLDNNNFSIYCFYEFRRNVIGFISIWSPALLTEIALVAVSLQGTIFNDKPRKAAEYLLYLKFVLWLAEILLTLVCIFEVGHQYTTFCELPFTHKNVVSGLVICNIIIFFTASTLIWCFYDVAGGSWVKLQKYQQHRRDGNSKTRDSKNKNKERPKLHHQHYERSGGNTNRSWRHRKVRLAYQSSWDHRFKMLCCCIRGSGLKGTGSEKKKGSFTAIAAVLSEFFRDLDVVPSDIVVGLVLLRKRQQLLRLRVIHQANNPVYNFLSGIRVTPDTKFLSFSSPEDKELVVELHHYMHYALAIYGWPMYMRSQNGQRIKALGKICGGLKCVFNGHQSASSSLSGNVTKTNEQENINSCPTNSNSNHHQVHLSQNIGPSVFNGSSAFVPGKSIVAADNCCGCNLAAYDLVTSALEASQLVYIDYHVDVGETPFMVAVDHERRAVVVCLRGTLSLQDVITDLDAEGEPIPVDPTNEDWIGHKGMVTAAAYVYRILKEEHLLTKAFAWDKEKGTQDYQIVCVGHSLGAGAAAILSIMLKQEFKDTKCFAFSPPGGTLSLQAMEASKDFIVSTTVGKDLVPRIGLHQLEALRHDLMYALHKSPEPKWRTLAASLTCCGAGGGSTNYFDTPGHCWTEEEIDAHLNSPIRNNKNSTAIAALSGVTNGDGPTSDENAAPGGTNTNAPINIHPWDSSINLSVHMPLYPPGRLLHLVRQYPKTEDDSGKNLNNQRKKLKPKYRGMWSENDSYTEVLISKRMVEDHMPDKVLEALTQFLNDEEDFEDKNPSNNSNGKEQTVNENGAANSSE